MKYIILIGIITYSSSLYCMEKNIKTLGEANATNAQNLAAIERYKFKIGLRLTAIPDTESQKTSLIERSNMLLALPQIPELMIGENFVDSMIARTKNIQKQEALYRGLYHDVVQVYI